MTQIAVRLDADAEAALERITARTGATRSQTMRDAVVALDREQVLEQMRRESLALADDAVDRAETQELLAEMRARRAW